MEKTKPKNKPYRKAPIDEVLLVNLAKIHCSLEEMASCLNCSVDTLTRRYADVIKRAQDEGKKGLRRKMFELALNGDKVMLIWLSKQHLGMSDKTYTEATGVAPKLVIQFDKDE